MSFDLLMQDSYCRSSGCDSDGCACLAFERVGSRFELGNFKWLQFKEEMEKDSHAHMHSLSAQAETTTPSAALAKNTIGHTCNVAPSQKL